MNIVLGKVKQAAELTVGILTQCIKNTTISGNKMNDATMNNLMLKINAKLNGINHKFDISTRYSLFKFE